MSGTPEPTGWQASDPEVDTPEPIGWQKPVDEPDVVVVKPSVGQDGH